MAEHMKTPKVRFLDNSKNWKEYKIGDLFTETNRSIILEDEQEYELVTVRRRNGGVVTRGHLKGKDILVKNYSQVREGDFIVSKRQVVHGATGIIPKSLDRAIVSNEYLVSAGNDKISSEFWTLLSKLPSMHKLFFLSSYGVDIEKLVFDVDDWKKRTINIPSPDEQEELLAFYGLLEKQLNHHQLQYKKLVNLKKAMLEKMFPKEGQAVPEIRFKQFSRPWEKVKFSKIAKLRRGLTYKPTDISKNGVRVLRSSNINEDKFIFRDDDVFVAEDTINIDFAVKSDILITSANGSSRLVGKHAVIKRAKGKMVPGGFMLLATTKNPFFLNASMSTSWYYNFVGLFTAGGGGSIGNLSKSDLEEQVLLQPSENEQLLIGKYFKNLDQLIDSHAFQIIKLSTLRNALLSKMFINAFN